MFGAEGMMARRGTGTGTGAGRFLAAAVATAIVTVGVRRSLVRVRGLSMRPTLRDGDLVVTLPLLPADVPDRFSGLARTVRTCLLRPGTVVVLSEPDDPTHLIIKRATEVSDDGVDVIGDDPGWSIDSRTFGTVPHRDVRRIVLGRLPLPRR